MVWRGRLTYLIHQPTTADLAATDDDQHPKARRQHQHHRHHQLSYRSRVLVKHLPQPNPRTNPRYISLDEMTKYLTSVFSVISSTSPEVFEQHSVTPEELAVATAKRCFLDADLNHDGKLDFDEFKAWWVGGGGLWGAVEAGQWGRGGVYACVCECVCLGGATPSAHPHLCPPISLTPRYTSPAQASFNQMVGEGDGSCTWG